MEDKVAVNKPEQPKKKGFRWLWWLVIVIIASGIAIGFYEPSFYKSADEYISKTVAKIMGKNETSPVTPAKVNLASQSLKAAKKTDTVPQSIMFTKTAKKAELKDETEQEEIIVDEVVATAPEIDTTAPLNPNSEKELNTLKKRVDVLEEKLIETAKERQLGAALVVAAMRLKDAAISGQDFTNELNALYGLAAGNKEMLGKIASLRPFANGVKTKNALKNELPVLVKTALKKEPETTGDFWNGALAKIKTLVVIRKVGESSEAEGENAALAQAEKAVAEGDLSAAQAALEKLPEAKQAVFDKWCENAQNLLQVDTLCDELIELAIAKIGGESKNKNGGENRL